METIKKCHYTFSFQKEKIWLEEMAAQGWFFKNVTLHFCYTFEKGIPQKGCYEIDRYNLPKNPTLTQLKEKDDFMEMAAEMGWKLLAHDEDLNYYYYKKYEENGINELYNDADARCTHGKKYYYFYTHHYYLSSCRKA